MRENTNDHIGVDCFIENNVRIVQEKEERNVIVYQSFLSDW
jgi:hypothetical protein